MYTIFISPQKKFHIFCIIFLVLAGCTAQTDPALINIQSQSSNSFIGVSVFTYKALVDKSELIVIGQVIEQAETFNTSRDPTNIHKPHPEFYNIGKIYVFSVDKYVKGNGDKNIYVVNREGTIPSGNPTSSMIEEASSKSNIYRFSTGKSYILFLSSCCKSAAGYDIPDRAYYSGSAEPWLFEISSSNQNNVVVKSQWEDAGKYFPALALTDMEKIIENPSSIPDSANFSSYPPPQNINGIESETPYP